MIEAVKYGLANYVNFEGRTGRATFWWWVLAVVIASVVAGILDTGLAGDDREPFSILLWLALFLPNLAMAARRLHDTGRSAWWLLINLIPVIGLLVLLFFFVQPSNPAGEKYDAAGPAPLPPEPPPAD